MARESGRVAALAALAAVAALACAGAAVTGGGVSTPGGVGVVVESARLGWGTKEVVAKREPETLVARDGTICRVSPDRFRDTAVGARVRCNWQ